MAAAAWRILHVVNPALVAALDERGGAVSDRAYYSARCDGEWDEKALQAILALNSIVSVIDFSRTGRFET
jgi:hypothetical protein